MEREALQMCLEYIETNAHERKHVRHAIQAALAQPAQDVDYWIREATAARQAEMAMRRELEAQPAQEPVARVTGVYGGRFTYEPLNPAMVLPVGMALYSAPPAQEKNL